MSAMSEAKKRANKKWNDANMKERYDRVQLVLPKGRKAELQAVAERHGQSVNGFINSLIDKALERERAGGAPAGSPAVEDGPGVDMVSAGGSPDSDMCSRLPSLTPPDFQTGLDTEPEPKQESFLDVVKRLNAMSPDELDKQLGTDPEGMERYRHEMERKRQRLAELNSKVGGLSRGEDAERRRLMVECKNYQTNGDSAQG